jgi:hypothetical protein
MIPPFYDGDVVSFGIQRAQDQRTVSWVAAPMQPLRGERSMTYFLSLPTSPPDSVRPHGMSEEFRADASGVSDSPSDDTVI